ncbi:hypothetical protein D3C78_1303370 [compost metagenome]
MTRHQYAVPGRHQVGLDEVGAQFDGLPVALQGVIRPVSGGTAVADDQGLGAIERRVFHNRAATTTSAAGQCQCGRQGQRDLLCCEPGHLSPHLALLRPATDRYPRARIAQAGFVVALLMNER